VNRTTTLTILLGLTVTLIVLLLDRLGALAPWERATIDLRFVAAPRPRQPMTGEIVHVDIDDGALDRLGRWPWDRSRLAAVIDELRRAEAATIAVDLVLAEPSADADAEHDARFAEAIAHVRCVLPVIARQATEFGPAWRTPEGEKELARLLGVLAADIQLDEFDALEAASITGTRRASFRERPLQFKRAAAWRALQEAPEPPESFEAFERLVAPDRSALVASYPERPMLQAVWNQHRAWQRIRPLLLPADNRGTERDQAPLPIFAIHADGVGYVNVDRQKDSDGSVRSLAVSVPAPGGEAMQFGLAAALTHRGLAARDVDITEDRLAVGEIALPLRAGRLWLDWPTSRTHPRWEGLLRDEPDDAPAEGHLSIRELVNLAESRRTHADNRAKLAEVTALVLRFANVPCEPGTELDERSLGAAADEVDFTLADAPHEIETKEWMSPDELAYLDHVHNCRTWFAAREAVREGEEKIDEASRLLRKAVEGKLVFIGWTATGAAADFVPTALDPRTPGVIVHATIAHMVLTGRGMRFPPLWSRVLMILVLGLLCTLAAERLPPLPSAVAAILLVAAYIGVAGLWLFAAENLLMPLAAPATAGGAAWIACTSLQAAISRRERQRITRQFKARVSTQLVDYLVDNPQAVSMTGEEREITVLFGDIAGFTAISERLGGPATVSTLNRYLGRLADVLVEHDAYLNKFLGDGLMAFWSAFATDRQQATKACRAALYCQAAVQELNRDAQSADLPELGLRIGIATGRVIVGDCGAPPALNDYTVIGDPVNLASRLESANRHFGTRILIDGRTKSLLEDGPPLRPIGRIAVVGRAAPVEVFEVLPSDAPAEMIELWRRLMDSFKARRLDRTIAALDELMERFGSDPLVDLYRQAIVDAREEFDGVIRLIEK
jgi:class 3 adenylate cyclase/CHASE2 domain-containing sensor protein